MNYLHSKSEEQRFYTCALGKVTLWHMVLLYQWLILGFKTFFLDQANEFWECMKLENINYQFVCLYFYNRIYVEKHILYQLWIISRPNIATKTSRYGS